MLRKMMDVMFGLKDWLVLLWFTTTHSGKAGRQRTHHTHTHTERDSHVLTCIKNFGVQSGAGKSNGWGSSSRSASEWGTKTSIGCICVCVCVCVCLWVVRGASSYTTTATKSSYLIVHLKRFGSMVIHHCHAMGECRESHPLPPLPAPPPAVCLTPLRSWHRGQVAW